jgi:hypothetical protein
MSRFARTALIFLLAQLIRVEPILACAVCGGDKQSDMVKGAESGVIVLLVVTYALLMGCGGMIAFWSIRSRRKFMSKEKK